MRGESPDLASPRDAARAAFLCGCDLHNPGNNEAWIITFYSLIATLVFFVTGLAIGNVTGSSTELSFAWENALDLIASIIVLWRFTTEMSVPIKHCNRGKPDPAAEHKAVVRERITSLLLSLAIIVLAIVVGIFSTKSLAKHRRPRLSGIYREEIGLEIYMAVPSAMVGSALGSLQIFIGGAIQSHSLTKDGLISVFSALTALGAWIGSTADILSHGATWYLDASISLVLALLLLIYGAHAVWHEVWTPWPSLAAAKGETMWLKQDPKQDPGTRPGSKV